MRIGRPHALSALLFLIVATAHASTPVNTSHYTLKRIGPNDFAISSTFTVNIDSSAAGTTPLVSVTGTVTLAATLVLNATGAPFPAGRTYVLIENDGTDPIIGTFIGLPEGAIIVSGGQAFALSYVGGTGNDVVLTTFAPVPALQPYALVVLALVLIAVALMAVRH